MAKWKDLFGSVPNMTEGLSTEHHLALSRVDKETMRQIIEPELREQIAREIEELPYYGSVKDAVENAAAIARGEK